MGFKADEIIQFAGLNGQSDPTVPDAFLTKYGIEPHEVPRLPTFSEVYHNLPIATETTAGYRNPWTQEWVETERFNALVDPDKLERAAVTDDVDPLWHIPTDNYGAVNPPEFYYPLEEAILEADWGDDVFGEARKYKQGGEVHMDIMFSGQRVDIVGDDGEQRDPLFAGLTTGYDFFGNTALYAEGFAMDTMCKNSMRSLTDKKSRRHVGDPSEDIDWWEDILTKLGGLTDHLAEMIEVAMDVEMDFRELPFDLQEFYELLGYPEYMARSAASHARVRASSGQPWLIDLWAAHSGATYAITHDFRGGENGAIEGYVRTANDMVQNPQMVVTEVEVAYERREHQRQQDGESNEGELDSGLAQINRLEQSIEDRKAEFEQNTEQMRELLVAGPDDGDAAEA